MASTTSKLFTDIGVPKSNQENCALVMKLAQEADVLPGFEKFPTYRLITAAEKQDYLANGAAKPQPEPMRSAQSIIDEEPLLKSLDIKAHATSPNKPKKIFLTVGCQGEANDEQKAVAQSMDRVVKRLQEQGYEVMCVWVMGDNIYTFGASSPDDKNFKECCDKPYADPATVPHLAKIPFFYIQGNHDQNRHGLRVPFTAYGIGVGLIEVARTLMPTAKYPTVKSRYELLHKKRDPREEEYYLVKEEQDHYNMLGRAYSIIIDDMELITLDSNTLVEDALDHKYGNNDNQIAWLKHRLELAKKEGRKAIIGLHHPPYSLNARNEGHDLGYYVEEKRKALAKNVYERYLRPEDDNNNALVKAVLTEVAENLGLGKLDIQAAHDHGIYVFNNTQEKKPENGKDSLKVCEIVSAGGGGKLQKHANFEDVDKNMFAFLDHFGFLVTESDTRHPDKLDFAIYNIYTPKDAILNQTFEGGDFPLMFSNQNNTPLRYHPSPEEAQRIEKYCIASKEKLRTYRQPADEKEYLKVMALTEAVTAAIDRYFKELEMQKAAAKKARQRFSVDYSEVACAHELRNYINRPFVSSFDATLITICKISKLVNSTDGRVNANELLNSFLVQEYSKKFNKSRLVSDYRESNNRLFPPNERRCLLRP